MTPVSTSPMPPCCHAAVPGDIHIHVSVRMGDDRVGPFQDQMAAVGEGKFPGNGNPVLLNFFNGDAGKPGHFSGVRRENHGNGKGIQNFRAIGQTVQARPHPEPWEPGPP